MIKNVLLVAIKRAKKKNNKSTKHPPLAKISVGVYSIGALVVEVLFVTSIKYMMPYNLHRKK